MSKTILTYLPYIEMVSYNSHTNIIDDELLILVTRVTNISFMEATLVTYKSNDLFYF